MENVSIYSVYYLVINGVTKVLKNSIQSVSAAFGDMLAKKEEKLIQINFDAFETLTASVSTVLFGTTLIMIVPFITVYTKGITDANYIQPLFATLIAIAGFFNCMRIPYQYLVEAAGHFKQTKHGAYFEAIMNICISVICVFKFGLVGVAIGTVCATVFRTIQFSVYMCKNIVKRSYWKVVKSLLSSIGVIAIAYLINVALPDVTYNNYGDWILIASRTFLIIGGLVCLTDATLFRSSTRTILDKAKGIVAHRK